MKTLSKTILAALATGVISCALFSQQAKATPEVLTNGTINFAGSCSFDTNNLATATTVTNWINTHVEAGSTGNFAGIPVNTPATFTAPWVFDSGGGIGGPHPGLWSVAGFTFDLLSSTVQFRSSSALVVLGTGVVSGNGFTPTTMDWSFSVTSSGGQRRMTFSFQASGNAHGVPDGGSAVALLGLALTGIEVVRRKLRA